MNYFQAIAVVGQLMSSPEFKSRKGDAALYAAARLLATRLEEKNPGIAQAAGFATEIS